MSYLWEKDELHPTKTWKEDNIYKARKIFETLSPVSTIEESIDNIVMFYIYEKLCFNL